MARRGGRRSGDLGELVVPPMIPSPGARLITLGNYRVRFAASPNPGLWLAASKIKAGRSRYAGSLRLSENRAYVTRRYGARARADAPPELSQGLELMTAPPDASGLRAIFLRAAACRRLLWSLL